MCNKYKTNGKVARLFRGKDTQTDVVGRGFHESFLKLKKLKLRSVCVVTIGISAHGVPSFFLC